MSLNSKLKEAALNQSRGQPSQSTAVTLTCPLTGEKRPVSQNALLGQTRDARDFEVLNQLGEGTYGVVCMYWAGSHVIVGGMMWRMVPLLF
jgi:hypothetical protein